MLRSLIYISASMLSKLLLLSSFWGFGSREGGRRRRQRRRRTRIVCCFWRWARFRSQKFEAWTAHNFILFSSGYELWLFWLLYTAHYRDHAQAGTRAQVSRQVHVRFCVRLEEAVQVKAAERFSSRLLQQAFFMQLVLTLCARSRIELFLIAFTHAVCCSIIIFRSYSRRWIHFQLRRR